MTIYSLHVLFFLFGTSLLFYVQFNCCFLTCIQISQEAGQEVWYSCLFQNFPQFIVIHTVKRYGIVNKAEIDVFLELSCFFDDPWMLAIWSLVPLPFLKPAWTSGSSQFTYCWSLAWRILSTLLNKNGECAFLTCFWSREIAFSFSPLSMLWPLLHWGKFLQHLFCWEVFFFFNHKWTLTLSKVFPASVELIIWFYSIC